MTRRTRSILVVALAANSGFVDAVGFLILGGAFTSVMTGNMVLLGASAGIGDMTLAINSATAIIAFITGCAIGCRLAGTAQSGDPMWPPAVSRALRVQFVLVLAFSIGWFTTDGDPSGPWRTMWLAVNAAALGLQSSAVQRFGVPGLSTTYLTGTLTQVVIKLTSTRKFTGAGLSVLLLIGLICGAVVGALCAEFWNMGVPVAQLLLLGGVLITEKLARSRCRGNDHTGT